jgi:hypothetical protein
MVYRSPIVVAIAIIATAHALPPSPDDVVPETKFFEATSSTGDHAAAQKIVTEMLQKGSDWGDCERLANETRNEVEDSVQGKQEMLDGLDKGCTCKDEGQDEVTRTHTEMLTAEARVTEAEQKLEEATHAEVQLHEQQYQVLAKGECGWIREDAAYIAADETFLKATTTLEKRKTEYTRSVEAHAYAVTEAARLRRECECKVKGDLEGEWELANQDNDANAKAWSQAHHIDCVVQSISEANCHFDAVPGLTMPTLCDHIASMSCDDEGYGSGDEGSGFS